MASHEIENAVRWFWRFMLKFLDSWGKAYVGAVGALIGLLVSDNLTAFTQSPYYLSVAYGFGGAVIVLQIVSILRRWKWGLGFTQFSAQGVAWIIGAIAVLQLKFAENNIGYYVGSTSFSYNILVTFSTIALLLFPSLIFLTSDLIRDQTHDLISIVTSRKKGRIVATDFL